MLMELLVVSISWAAGRPALSLEKVLLSSALATRIEVKDSTNQILSIQSYPTP
jgi:hypothetical protein